MVCLISQQMSMTVAQLVRLSILITGFDYIFTLVLFISDQTVLFFFYESSQRQFNSLKELVLVPV